MTEATARTSRNSDQLEYTRLDEPGRVRIGNGYGKQTGSP